MESRSVALFAGVSTGAGLPVMEASVPEHHDISGREDSRHKST